MNAIGRGTPFGRTSFSVTSPQVMPPFTTAPTSPFFTPTSPFFTPNLFTNFPFSFMATQSLSISASIPTPLILSRLFNSIRFGQMSPFFNTLGQSRLQNALWMNPLLNGSAPNSALTGAGLAGGYGGGGYGGGYGGSYAPSSSTTNPYDMYGSYTAANQGTSYGNSVSDSITGGEYGGESAGRDPILNALGLSNKNGRLDWPLGLIALPGEQSKKLRQQVEAVILVGANNKTINPRLVEEARLALDRLQSLAQSNRLSMTPGTYKDSEEFLGQLDHVLKLLQK
jgi:hypothetical protein